MHAKFFQIVVDFYNILTTPSKCSAFTSTHDGVMVACNRQIAAPLIVQCTMPLTVFNINRVQALVTSCVDGARVELREC